MENYLHEAFQAFKALDEDVFPATQDGEEALRKFLDGDDLDDVQVIIDADAEDETELKNSYVGDVILKCPVCQSMTYKEQDQVDIDAEKGLANVEETCPYCQSEGGFEIVGQVAEYCPECAHEDRDAPEDFEEKEDVEVEAKSNLKESYYSDRIRLDITDTDNEDLDTTTLLMGKSSYENKAGGEGKYYIEVNPIELFVNALENSGVENAEDIVNDLIDDDSLWEKLTKNQPKDSHKLKEDTDQLGAGLSRYQKWVDYDMKRYGKISARTKGFLDKAGLEVVKDDHGAWVVMAKEKDGKDLTEAVDSVKVTTEDQEIVVEADGEETEVKVKPRYNSDEIPTEVIEPVTDEVEAKLTVDDDENFEDETIDEFDEESFDELEEKYLKGIYENVTSYKTTKGSMEGDKIILEGVITFASGKQKKTTTIFESHTITKKGKVRFLGENLNITKSKKAFVLTGNVNGKKLISESLTYNYGTKDESGKSQRLYGTVRK